MSEEDTKKPASRGASSSAFALVGILVVLAIAVVANYLFGNLGLFNLRFDLTEDKLYTLSDGTKNILGKVDAATPVTLRYYVTDDERAMPDGLKTYARNVQDLLNEFKKASKGKVTVERYDPAPDTEAEDAAILDGIPAQSLNLTDSIRFGLSVSCLDKQVAIPALDPRRETLLEYDVARAISEVLAVEKPVLGVMSALPVAGPAMMLPPQMGGGNQQPWYVYTSLERDYEVRRVEMAVEAIDPEIDVLLVIHPYGISDRAQFAIDQFVLRGGSLIACLDAHCIAARMSQPQPNPLMPQAAPPQVGTTSNLDKLLEAWGITYDETKVIADMSYRTTLQGGRAWPGILTLTGEAINEEDMLTADLSDLTFVFSGAFLGGAATGLKQEVLVSTSPLSQFVNPFDAENNDDGIMTSFVASDTRMPLAIRLSGTFRSAFPDGLEPPAEEGAEAPKEEKPGQLKESSVEGSVVLIADADWIYDQFCVQVAQVLGGGTVAIPRNSNLPLMQNVADQLAGDSDLIEVRSRASSRRPFEKFEQMTAEAEQAYSAKIAELENDRQMVQREISEIQRSREDDQKEFLTAEQQDKLEELRATYRKGSEELRQVQKDLTKDIDRLEAKLTMANILIMPILVAWVGIGLAIYRKIKTAAH